MIPLISASSVARITSVSYQHLLPSKAAEAGMFLRRWGHLPNVLKPETKVQRTGVHGVRRAGSRSGPACASVHLKGLDYHPSTPGQYWRLNSGLPLYNFSHTSNPFCLGLFFR
jgi:hypothetical protein